MIATARPDDPALQTNKHKKAFWFAACLLSCIVVACGCVSLDIALAFWAWEFCVWQGGARQGGARRRGLVLGFVLVLGLVLAIFLVLELAMQIVVSNGPVTRITAQET